MNLKNRALVMHIASLEQDPLSNSKDDPYSILSRSDMLKLTGRRAAGGAASTFASCCMVGSNIAMGPINARHLAADWSTAPACVRHKKREVAADGKKKQAGRVWVTGIRRDGDI